MLAQWITDNVPEVKATHMAPALPFIFLGSPSRFFIPTDANKEVLSDEMYNRLGTAMSEIKERDG